MDRSGNAVPADLKSQPPGLNVVVDTAAPEVEVQPLAGALVRCEAHDTNLDPGQTRFEYQRPDRSWRQLEPVPSTAGVYRFPGQAGWPDESEWTGLVRATAADRAGNVTVRDFPLRPAPASPPGRVDSRADKPPVPTLAPEQPARPAQAPAARLLLNSTHASLEYHIDQVGPSGVGRVEVWLTRDGGQTWARLCEDPDRRSPVEFDLPGEGLFGVALVVSNGNGVGDAPPAAGEAPECWIEVDTTRPTAQLLAVRPGAGADAGSLLLFWTAADKNFGPEPVSLFYATQKDGPWQPIARGIKNDGSYRWTPPRDAGPELYFRLEVTDLAGNVARSDLAERVLVDLARPRARVLGVSAGAGRLTPPAGN